MGNPPLAPSAAMTISEKDLELKIPDDDDAGHNEGEITELNAAQERRVLSKFDIFVMPYMALLVLFGYLDRTNIGNARVFGFEEDTGMSGTDFNDISMYFYVTYVIFETPWVMAVKRFGPGRVLAVAIVGWSAITIGTGFTNSYGEVIACRVLLGAAEAGLFPALTFVVSQIYPAASQGKRVAVLYISIAISGAVGGLIAYGIQTMGARHGLSAWRWLFIIEGIVSLFVGAAGWICLPTSPEKAWFLNAEEKSTMLTIKERNNPLKETKGFSWKQVSMALTDPVVYLVSIALFCSSVAMFGFTTFLPTLLKNLDYTSLQANYLSIPVYVLASISAGATTYVSDRLNRRAVCLIHSPLLVIAGYAIALGTGHKGVGFFAMFLVGAGIYSFNTVMVTWLSNNTHPDYKRSLAISMVLSIGNAAGMAASQIYPSKDEPRYIMGNAVSLGGDVIALFCVGLMYLLYKYRMRRKERLLAEGHTSDGKEDDRGLGFKYVF